MAATDSSILPFEERPDLSPFIVHLTKNTKNEDEYDAFDNLVSILMTGEIFGSQTATGFIKGKSPATCFMDVPLNSLKYVLNKRNTDPEHPRYEAYGIVLPKNWHIFGVADQSYTFQIQNLQHLKSLKMSCGV